MATVASLNTCKSDVISLIQASETPYATTVDGSNAQYSSDAEILNSILYADAEICDVINNTAGHPFQNSFEVTSSALVGGVPGGVTLPAMTGMVLKVMTLNGQGDLTGVTWSDTTDILTKTAHGLTTGQAVQWTTTNAPVGGGFVTGTNYYVIKINANTFYLATSPFNAYGGTHIDISAVAAGGTNTLTMQYIDAIKAKSADEVIAIIQNGSVYSNDWSSNSLMNFWFVEGKILYVTSLYAKVVYTDFTLTSTVQAPEQYLNAIVAGAIAHLTKDGSDHEMAAYYAGMYANMLSVIGSRGGIVPPIIAYRMAA